MSVLPVGFGSAAAGGTPAGAVERSLRFNGADDAYVSRTFGTPTSNKKWTYSVWMKRSAFAANQIIMSSNVDGAEYWDMRFNTSDQILVQNRVGSSNLLLANTTAVYRDPSAWYHIVFVFDSDNATAANRNLLYVNNVNYTLSANSGSGNASAWNVNSVQHNIGVSRTLTTGGGIWAEFNGYQTEIYFVDGQALTPSSFGETDSATGVWKPKAYTGTYGTNGFELNFSDNSNTTAATLGKDYSGNGNNWTPNNFSVTAGAGNDSMVDSPTPYGTDTGVGGSVRGNYCTLNPILSSANITFSNGNLDAAVGASSGVYRTAGGTIAISSGKWYFESIAITPFANSCVGVGDVTQSKATWESDTTTNSNFWFVNPLNGNKINGSGASYGSAYSNGDIINCAVDMDNGKIWWGKNGTWFASGDPAAGTNAAYTNLSGKTVTPAYFGGSSASGGATHTANFGQRAFAYTAPSGFKALCTTNLPTPTIGATSTTQAGKYFNTILYTGNGNASRSITGVGFQPDFVWAKARSAAYYHGLFDAVRSGYALYSNATDVEDTTEQLTFGSDGFTTPNKSGDFINTNSATYVAWNWNAGGSTVTNTSGTISAQVRANTTSGFSIVTYTGTSANATVGHGLGVAPKLVIAKKRDAGGGWGVWHTALAGTDYLLLNTTAAKATAATVWNSTIPTSTVFSLGSDGIANLSSTTHVAYVFAEVAGYSAFGSYTGNGSTDGPFVFTNFRPRYVMIKRTDNVGDWWTFDAARNTFNVADSSLMGNTSAAEIIDVATQGVDFLSNGFKLKKATYQPNSSGGTFIYMAFAETPAKFSLAR